MSKYKPITHAEIISEGERLTGLILKAEARGDSQMVDRLLQEKLQLIRIQAGITIWQTPQET
jgi:hypothetical protein